MSYSSYDNGQDRKNFRNNENNNANFRGKHGGRRDTGGFRIRLSDNEMKSVKMIQDTFQLKSTVAVLGFSVRTMSELIKDEKFREEIVKISKNNKNFPQKGNKNDTLEPPSSSVPNPFARPEKKQTASENKDNTDNVDES